MWRHFFQGILQSKLGIITNLQDQYLSANSNVNLSPIQSPNVKLLFEFDMSPFARTEIIAVEQRSSPIHYRINECSKTLIVHKHAFTKIQCKSEKLLLSQNCLPPCLTASRPCTGPSRYILNTSRHCLSIQFVCMQPPLFFHYGYVFEYIYLHTFQFIIFLEGLHPFGSRISYPHTTCNGLITNHSLGLQS